MDDVNLILWYGAWTVAGILFGYIVARVRKGKGRSR